MKRVSLTLLLVAAACSFAQDERPPKGRTSPTGYSDTPVIPGQPWKVHDIQRPHPRVVTPAALPGGAPSDAIVLFDGKDLSKWMSHKDGQVVPGTWKVEKG